MQAGRTVAWGVGMTGDPDADRVDCSDYDEDESGPTVPHDQRKPGESAQEQLPLPPHPTTGITGDHHDDQRGSGEERLVVSLATTLHLAAPTPSSSTDRISRLGLGAPLGHPPASPALSAASRPRPARALVSLATLRGS